MAYLLNPPGLLFALLLLGLVASFQLGRLIRRRVAATAGDAADEPAQRTRAALEGVMFALLGLLLAFSFSGAASRFELRAQRMVDEANAIGTAWLRLDLLPADAQAPIRTDFRRYVDSRIGIHDLIADPPAFQRAMRASTALQQGLWAKSVAAVQRPDAPPSAAMLLLPALNEMIDITTTRAMQTRIHTPAPILLMLVSLAFVCTAVIGNGAPPGATPDRLRLWAYGIVVALALSTVIDLEYPRFGLIRLSGFETELVRLARQ